MAYRSQPQAPSPAILRAAAAAEDAVARLDQVLISSPIADGWRLRTHIHDAAASLWLDGHLVALEDLVLHDARMDVRSPTHELTRAHTVLRVRRRLAAADAAFTLSSAGLDGLRRSAITLTENGEPDQADAPGSQASKTPPVSADADLEPDGSDDPLDAELAALDALIARSSRTLAEATTARREPENKAFILYDLDWDGDARLAEWREALTRFEGEPPVLAAALTAEAWTTIEPLQRGAWLGRLLVPVLLRRCGKTRAHLLTLNSGLKTVPRQRRLAQDPEVRLLAWIEGITAAADAGLKDHARWLLAKRQLERRIAGRRKNSRLPALIDLVMASPLVSTGMVARDLGVSQRAAQTLIADLGLREATGRSRYRAWGVF